jgi:hypothetical protein
MRAARPGLARVLGIALIAACALAIVRPSAQVVPEADDITPIYEGWEKNDDGTFNLVFGYLNRSWSDAIHVPLGPDNNLAPGGPDLGQPTYLYPRRNRFVFRVRVPADFGTREIVWTLTARGKTQKAYGTLKPDYVIDDVVLMGNTGAGGALSMTPDMIGNKAPTLEVHGASTRAVRAGEPVELTAVATDDGKPRPRNMQAVFGGNYMLPASANGLRLSWSVYRGEGAHVTFDPPQTEVWEDTRDGGNSPWSVGFRNLPVPPDNTWRVRASFSQPGTYTLRGIAHDGGLATVRDVVVTVAR